MSPARLIAPSPKPIASVVETTIIFLEFEKSTFASTNALRPLALIIPNSTMDAPPITALGIVARNSPKGTKRPATTAMQAAQKIFLGL